MSLKIRITEIVGLASTALRRTGLDEDDIKIVLSHLLDGELSGHASHGFYRIPGIVRTLEKKGASTSNIALENETPFSVLVNGGGRLGLVVAQRATATVIRKAKASRIGIVGAYNYIGTTGAMGYYSREIVQEELIGIVICNSEYAMAPWGGMRAILGTNPISISIPTGHDPVVADLATSAWSYGDLAIAMKENRQIPYGIVLDKYGNPSTDPNDADNGCQLPMAGHKGYALGLAVEILAGPFVRAKTGREAVPGSDGFTVLAVDPSLFTPIQRFESEVSALINEIKNSPRAPGSTEILVPGERSSRTRARNKGAEFIELPDSVVADIKALAGS